jgi:hypothetical protein
MSKWLWIKVRKFLTSQSNNPKQGKGRGIGSTGFHCIPITRALVL